MRQINVYNIMYYDMSPFFEEKWVDYECFRIARTQIAEQSVGISGINGIEKKGDSSYDHTFTPEGIWKDKSGAGRTGEKVQRVS